ncbi:hypothetical protein [Alteromonas mediterranea]|uniref:hypothetical protein n=1 Tax=Alteromonas mediterranea TaxID=314275 RepID=UPI0012FC3E45|nr:hypothetical protein [Alteromonas mediterranea]QGX63085.1 hypothetical protein FJN15_15460 [Alteromonas mediterranea]
MDYNEQKALENAKNRAFKLSSLLFASLFGALTFLLYQIGLEAFSSSSAKQLRDEYGDSSITYTGLYIGHLCYFFANRFYNHLLKDVKGFKVCLYDEFVKLKWIIGTTIFIIVRTLVVSFIDMALLARAAIILVTLALLIYWLKNWDYHVEKSGTE